jgi:hypothetical protein
MVEDRTCERAHLDERWPGHLIDKVEVVRGDPAIELVVAEPRHPATVGVRVVGGAGNIRANSWASRWQTRAAIPRASGFAALHVEQVSLNRPTRGRM